MKAFKDDPKNKDVKNAFVHCNALAIGKATFRVVRKGIHKRTKMETTDVRQIALSILAYNLRTFRPETGVRFNTVLTGCLDRWLIGVTLRGPRQITAYQFAYDDDGASTAEGVEQDREPLPLQSILTFAARDDVKMMLSCVSPRDRLFIKLLYGIRFEGASAEPWTQDRIGELCGITHEAVGQAVAKALIKIKEIKSFRIGMPYLDDGDIYLATVIGVAPDSKNLDNFNKYCMKGSAWLIENEGVIRVFLGRVEKGRTSTRAGAWFSFSEELGRSNHRQGQMAKRPRKIRPLEDKELKRYKQFKRLVAEYIYGEGYTEAERESLLRTIVDAGPLRTPVKNLTVTIKGKRSSANPEGKYTRRELSLSELRGRRELMARNRDFNDIVYIIPTVVKGRLNIEVRNSMSENAPPLYNSYWDMEKDSKGGAVDVSTEYAGFFMDDTNTLAVPGRAMVKRPILGDAMPGYLQIFEQEGARTEIYTDPAYAYIDSSRNTTGRIYWIYAFRDEKGKGLTIHLNPGGAVVGRAYYRNGEFIPEPGPLLRSGKYSILTADKTANFVERLKALGSVFEGIAAVEDRLASAADSVVVVKRDAHKYSKKLSDGRKVTVCQVSPFGRVDNKISYVAVGEVKHKKRYYLKFLPFDNRFEAYPSEECRPIEKVTEKFYDLDTLSVFDAREELKRRFDGFVRGAIPNPIVVRVGGQASGRIYFSDGQWVNMGKANRGRNYFVVFSKSSTGIENIEAIYIYEMKREPGGGIKPVRLVKTVYFIEVDFIGRIKNPVLLDDPSFKPYPLRGQERILAQEMAYSLGYMSQPKPITPREEMEEAARAVAAAASSVLRPVAAGERGNPRDMHLFQQLPEHGALVQVIQMVLRGDLRGPDLLYRQKKINILRLWALDRLSYKEIKERLQVTYASSRQLKMTAISELAEWLGGFGVSRSHAKVALEDIRGRLFQPSTLDEEYEMWYKHYTRWLAGEEESPPAILEFDMEDKIEWAQTALLLQMINIPKPEFNKGCLVPRRDEYGYIVEIRHGDEIRHKYLVRGKSGKVFKSVSSAARRTARSTKGGELYLLLSGYGPVDLCRILGNIKVTRYRVDPNGPFYKKIGLVTSPQKRRIVVAIPESYEPDYIRLDVIYEDTADPPRARCVLYDTVSGDDVVEVIIWTRAEAWTWQTNKLGKYRYAPKRVLPKPRLCGTSDVEKVKIARAAAREFIRDARNEYIKMSIGRLTEDGLMAPNEPGSYERVVSCIKFVPKACSLRQIARLRYGLSDKHPMSALETATCLKKSESYVRRGIFEMKKYLRYVVRREYDEAANRLLDMAVPPGALSSWSETDVARLQQEIPVILKDLMAEAAADGDDEWIELALYGIEIARENTDIKKQKLDAAALLAAFNSAAAKYQSHEGGVLEAEREETIYNLRQIIRLAAGLEVESLFDLYPDTDILEDIPEPSDEELQMMEEEDGEEEAEDSPILSSKRNLRSILEAI